MSKLVWKDLLVLKKQMYWSVLYLLIIILGFSISTPLDDFIYIMGGYGASYVLIMGALMAESKSQIDIFLNSLPVTRYEIILSKYLSGIALILLILGAAGILGLIINWLPLPLNIAYLSAMDAGVVLLMAAFTLAVVIPLNMKFGNQGARITMVLLFLLLFFAPVWSKDYLVNRQTEWGQVLTKIGLLKPEALLATASGLILFLLGLSLLISLQMYKNRDF